MKSLLCVLAAGAAHLALSATPAGAVTPNAAPSFAPKDGIVLVAEGCGPGRWRGPWGGCRGPGWAPGYYPPPVYAPPPPAYYGGPVYGGNGCPPGYWHGPWGHCRDTPYHGRLPDGGWR